MRAWICLFVVLLMILTIPAAVIAADLAIPSQFTETYYGALGDLYRKLEETEGAKIVILGTSSVPFGVDSALLTQELRSCGLDYTVCNFGLYGTLGMKLMMDLSLEHIRQGDIVILSPELDPEVMSLAVHGGEVWRAIEDRKELFWKIPEKGNLMGSFFGYIAEKLTYHATGTPAVQGIYARASFDTNGDLRYGDREYNIMVGGYDPNNPIAFDPALVSDRFAEILNDFGAAVEDRGATVWYSFAPMNRSAVTSTDAEIEAFCDKLLDALDFELLGDPYSSVYAEEWFYDSNFHLNASGMVCRTAQLAEEIKTKFGVTAPNLTALPEAPAIPETVPETGEDEQQYAAYFQWEAGEDGAVITGLSELGREQETLFVPGTVSGMPVVEIRQGVFAQSAGLKEVVISEDLRILHDGIFAGCGRLERITLRQTDPGKLSVGQGLLEGAEDCVIAVPRGALGAYQVDYFWSHYAGNLQAG